MRGSQWSVSRFFFSNGQNDLNHLPIFCFSNGSTFETSCDLDFCTWAACSSSMATATAGDSNGSRGAKKNGGGFGCTTQFWAGWCAWSLCILWYHLESGYLAISESRLHFHVDWSLCSAHKGSFCRGFTCCVTQRETMINLAKDPASEIFPL